MSLLEIRTRPPSFQAVNTSRTLEASEMGGLHVDRILPEFTELARTGKLYGAAQTVDSAIAPLQLVPTTTAAFVVYNSAQAVSQLLGGVERKIPPTVLIPIACGAILGSGTA